MKRNSSGAAKNLKISAGAHIPRVDASIEGKIVVLRQGKGEIFIALEELIGFAKKISEIA